MSLRDYQPPTRTIPLHGDNKLTLRALGFDDMQHLIFNRSGLVDQALELFGADGFDPDTLDPDQARNFGARLIASLPARLEAPPQGQALGLQRTGDATC